MTETGRWSKGKPELQNIPAPKSAFHDQIKKLVADHNKSISDLRGYLTMNYSTIELRMLISQERANGR